MSAPTIGNDYILNEKREPVAVPWSKGLYWWMAHADAWKVGWDALGPVSVITSFLGRRPEGQPEPLRLFETRIFGGDYGGQFEYFATWDEAEAGHARWVVAVRAAEG